MNEWMEGWKDGLGGTQDGRGDRSGAKDDCGRKEGRKGVMVLWALMTMTCVAASHTDFSGEFGFV